MPALRRKTAGAFVMLVCMAVWAVPVKPGHAQILSHPPPAPSNPQPPAASPAPPAPAAQVRIAPLAPTATAPAASATPVPQPASPMSGASPAPPAKPNPAAASSAPATGAAAPNPPVSRPPVPSPAAPTLHVPAAKTAAKPEQKQTPKPGPGAIDAGRAAASLRTTKLSLVSLIDRTVIGKDKGEIGHVIDVLVDAKGEPAALVVDVGGFMGMGNRRIAIAWERFALAGRKPNDALQLPLSDAQVKAAPAYSGSEDVTVVQGAIEPTPAKPPAPAPAPAPAPPPAKIPDKKSVDPSRVDLGDGPIAPSDDTAPSDPLNPD
jgi:hypothetical protein